VNGDGGIGNFILGGCFGKCTSNEERVETITMQIQVNQLMEKVAMVTERFWDVDLIAM